jgi:hypothetical protein
MFLVTVAFLMPSYKSELLEPLRISGCQCASLSISFFFSVKWWKEGSGDTTKGGVSSYVARFISDTTEWKQYACYRGMCMESLRDELISVTLCSV